MTNARKQVFLAHNKVWADVVAEDDEWMWATDPVDGIPTMVDRNYPHLSRAVDGPESDGEPH
jgi:hypothetical protein